MTTEPTTNDAQEVRVFHRADGWTLFESPTVEPCTSNYHREREGEPLCSGTAVWKVVELHGTGASIGFYCDSDLPSEHRNRSDIATVAEDGKVTIEGHTFDVADAHRVRFDQAGRTYIGFYRDGVELSATALPNGAAEDLGASLTQGTAMAHNRQVAAADWSFEDIVDADAGLSPMYRAVVQAEQREPDALPIVIGLKAWTLLDPEQQRDSLKELLQAYVDVVQHQRDGIPIR